MQWNVNSQQRNTVFSDLKKAWPSQICKNKVTKQSLTNFVVKTFQVFSIKNFGWLCKCSLSNQPKVVLQSHLNTFRCRILMIKSISVAMKGKTAFTRQENRMPVYAKFRNYVRFRKILISEHLYRISTDVPQMYWEVFKGSNCVHDVF